MRVAIVRAIDGRAKRLDDCPARSMSALVPTIGYRDRTDHPWPRILQFIAIITMIYGASRMGLKICEAWFVWDFQKGSSSFFRHSQLPWLITSVIEILMGLLLIIGAVTLLRDGSQRLIVAGQWGTVISWFAIFIVGYMMRPSNFTLSLAF